MIEFIIMSLVGLVTAIIQLTLIAIATQIDGGTAVANAANQHVQGIFIFFFILNLLFVCVVTFGVYGINAGNKNKLIVITNTLSVAY